MPCSCQIHSCLPASYQTTTADWGSACFKLQKTTRSENNSPVQQSLQSLPRGIEHAPGRTKFQLAELIVCNLRCRLSRNILRHKYCCKLARQRLQRHLFRAQHLRSKMQAAKHTQKTTCQMSQAPQTFRKGSLRQQGDWH